VKYLLTYKVFSGLFWDTHIEEYDCLEALQDKLNDHPRVNNVRIFEVSKEIKIKYIIEEVE